jgi:hypothetical protein
MWMAAGGMLGGLFITFVAPLLFVSIAEYPLLIAAACFAIATPSELVELARNPRLLLRPLAAAALAAAILAVAARYDIEPILLLPLLGIPALLAFSLSRQPARFAAAVALLLAAGLVAPGRGWGGTLYARRTFFGLYRVTATRDNRFVTLFHGTTLHGSERLGAEGPPEPLTYYYRGSPIADVFATRNPAAVRSVGVIGLGVGSLAAYATPGQRWTFYEIDPEVERIARDDRFFTFLSTCGPECRVEIGDGRLTLDAAPEVHDVLVLDAFSSDAIPVHLLTREALAIYLRHLAPSGVLAFHISNRHFDLQPVIGRLAADAGLVAAARLDDAPPGNSNYSPSRWMAVARSVEGLGRLTADPKWASVTADRGRVWTDDFSNVWSVLRWR